MDYVDRIRQLRIAKGLLQKDMSELLGIAKSTYSMYETRQRKMDIETFAKLCKFFGVSADELLGL